MAKLIRRFIAKNHTLGFGKYKDKTVKELLILDPDYLKWCKTNLKHIRFTGNCSKKINKALKY